MENDFKTNDEENLNIMSEETHPTSNKSSEEALTDFTEFGINTLRYVAVFKVKDFSQLLVKNPKNAFNHLVKLDKLTQKIKDKTIKYKFEEFTCGNRISVHSYMDTITFLSKGNTNVDCIAMLQAASTFFIGALSLNVFLSGYLSFGHFYIQAEKNIFCGNPFLDASIMAGSMQMVGLACDKVVEENLYEVKMLTKDKQLFSKFGHSLLTKWNVPIYGHILTGGSVRKEMTMVDWPRLSSDVFETIKSYSLDEFYEPYQAIYGEFSKLDNPFQLYIEESLKFMNLCLNQTVKMVNATT